MTTSDLFARATARLDASPGSISGVSAITADSDVEWGDIRLIRDLVAEMERLQALLAKSERDLDNAIWHLNQGKGLPLLAGGDQPTPSPERLSVNPEPLQAQGVPVCRTCGKRAPWCSCGEANYSSPEDGGP